MTRSTMDGGLFLSALRARFPVFALALIVTVAVATIVSMTLPESYQSTASVVVDTRNEQSFSDGFNPVASRERMERAIGAIERELADRARELERQVDALPVVRLVAEVAGAREIRARRAEQAGGVARQEADRVAAAAGEQVSGVRSSMHGSATT